MITLNPGIDYTAGELAEGVDQNNARILYANKVEPALLTSDEANSLYPVTNLGLAPTWNRWRAESTYPQAVTCSLAAAETVNSFAIAGHNLGTGATGIQLQHSADGSTWHAAAEEITPTDDTAHMEEFEDITAQYWRIALDPGTAIPEIAVWYLGYTLRMQRRIYVGHAPLDFNHAVTVSSAFSESGQFLGRVKRREMAQTSAKWDNLTPAWTEDYLKPFIESAKESPFFFAWRPGGYPKGVAYMWTTSQPNLSNTSPNGRRSFELDMQGVP